MQKTRIDISQRIALLAGAHTSATLLHDGKSCEMSNYEAWRLLYALAEIVGAKVQTKQGA